jgi:hypothetical protein
MRGAVDDTLIRTVKGKYEGRMPENVLAFLDHGSTEFHVGLYKRGAWMFRQGDTGQCMAVRQFPTGRNDDIRLRTDNAPWVPSAVEKTQ